LTVVLFLSFLFSFMIYATFDACTCSEVSRFKAQCEALGKRHHIPSEGCKPEEINVELFIV